MPRLVVAEGALLARVIDAMPPASRDGLSAAAFATLEKAVQKTAWTKAHRRRFALMDGDVVLATALRGRLAARLDGQPVRIGAVGSLWADPARGAVACRRGPDRRRRSFSREACRAPATPRADGRSGPVLANDLF